MLHRIDRLSVAADQPGRGHRGAEEGAAVVAILLREPGGHAGLLRVLAAHRPAGERKAGDLAVVVHAKARELDCEVGAVAAPHQLEQPVVAQSILDVGAIPALDEGGELGGLNLADPIRRLPVVDPHRERVLLGRSLCAQVGEAGAVVATVRVARVGDRGLEGLGSYTGSIRSAGVTGILSIT